MTFDLDLDLDSIANIGALDVVLDQAEDDEGDDEILQI